MQQYTNAFITDCDHGLKRTGRVPVKKLTKTYFSAERSSSTNSAATSSAPTLAPEAPELAGAVAEKKKPLKLKNASIRKSTELKPCTFDAALEVPVEVVAEKKKPLKLTYIC